MYFKVMQFKAYMVKALLSQLVTAWFKCKK